MRNIKSAHNVTGHLIKVNNTIMFRVYKENHEFTDYDIFHHDLEVKIIDTDAFLYDDSYIDYSTTTLGVDYRNNTK